MKNFRLILKDTEGRAVMFDIPGFKELGSGKGEKKLVKDYNKLLAEEKAYAGKIATQKKEADEIGKAIEKEEEAKLKKEAKDKDVAKA